MDLDAPTRELLTTYGFDEVSFSKLRRQLADGELGVDRNRLRSPVCAPEADDVQLLAEPGSSERQRLHALGAAAIRRGEVGCVILAGGMATRFGGVVKASVEALPGRSFLDLKLSDIRACATALGGVVPAYLMSSFATDAALRELAVPFADPVMPVEVFSQFISLRLDEQGGLFLDAQGQPSPYAPGHGDLSFALRRSGVLGRFLAGGGRMLCMSNVDNLAATLDPAVVGFHLQRGCAVTAEVVSKDEGDAGGAPARVDGTPQIVEDFRFPEGFDKDSIPVFNVNSFCFDAHAIDRDFPLTWFVVNKKVDGRMAVQFEHLVGELTACLPSAFLHVQRRGPDGRFQPVKDPQELQRRRPDIDSIMRQRGVL